YTNEDVSTRYIYADAVQVTLSTSGFIHFFFFFSSRRRHTRFSRDWSSDVCSSDLGRADGVVLEPRPDAVHHRYRRAHRPAGAGRSEERRVGKECRSLGTRHHYKKKTQREENHDGERELCWHD